jgi:hypothetical protein
MDLDENFKDIVDALKDESLGTLDIQINSAFASELNSVNSNEDLVHVEVV